eukprot:scaffold45247_cov365-Isochrysis_galbana.AAC.1
MLSTPDAASARYVADSLSPGSICCFAGAGGPAAGVVGRASVRGLVGAAEPSVPSTARPEETQGEAVVGP